MNMILNRGAQYTLQAMIYLAGQPPSRMVLVREMADRLGLPPHYLAKLMYPLGRAGWLESSRGRHGGYRLRGEARTLSLAQILSGIQSEGEKRDCLLGLKACGDDDACVLHCHWRPVRDELLAYLEAHSLGELADGDSRLPDAFIPTPRRRPLQSA